MRFRLRSLLVVFLLLAFLLCSLAWQRFQMKWIRDRQDVFPTDPSSWPRLATGFLVGTEGNDAPWSIRLFGAPGYSTIYVIVNDTSHPTEQDQMALRDAKRIFPEARVDFATESFNFP